MTVPPPLTPARRLPPPPWMQAPETLAVMRALNGDDETPQALFVGGCVRNALLGLPHGDIDIATRLMPTDMTARLEAAGIKVVPTGIAHGTVTAVTGGATFEITTLRRDIETDGRHAVVAFTDDWREDAARRDFTMNTLLADMDGQIYDPLGQGIADAEAGRVIFVGDPAARIAEDYLRVLRFFRFHAWYGRGEADAMALAACRKAANKLGHLSRERTGREFLRLLEADFSLPALRLMFANNLLSGISHKKDDLLALEKLINLEKNENALCVMARLVTLTGCRYETLASLEKFIVFSNAQRQIFSEIINASKLLYEISNKSLKRLIFQYKYSALPAARVAIARGLEDHALIRDNLRDWQPPSLPVTGDDVLRIGIQPGPNIGKLLGQINEWWLVHDFLPSRTACLEQLAYLINNQ